MATLPLGVAAVETGPASYVDWCAIAAGAVVASAVAIILFTFGTAIGLSMVSPYEGEGVSRAVYLATLGLWTAWVIISSFMAGGYLAGRLRKRVGDATEHEVEVRDGAHGVIVWATGIVLASLLLALGVSGVVGTAAKVGGDAAGETTAYTVDSLFRPQSGQEPAQVPAQPVAGGEIDPGIPAPRQTQAGPDSERDEVWRILTYGMTRGELGADNTAYVAQLVAQRTGLSPAEARTRVETVMARAKQTADAARKTGLIVGFLTAAALLIGGAAAAWAATLGGQHRDRGTDLSAFWRWA